MRQRYKAFNSAVPTSNSTLITPVTLTNAIKTQLQITAPSTGQLEIIEWGCWFTGSTLQQPVQVELLTTGTVAGTGMTAVTPIKFGDPNAPASAATAGFTPSAEGTITTTRVFDCRGPEEIGEGGPWQFPLGERPIVDVSTVLRARTSTAALTAFPGFVVYVLWAE